MLSLSGSSSDLFVEREGDSLTVRSMTGIGRTMVGLAVCGVALLFALLFIISGTPREPSQYWGGLVFLMSLVVLGGWTAVPRGFKTVFDLPSQRVHLLQIDGRRHTYHRGYAFTEVSGVGVREVASDDPPYTSYMPVIVTTHGWTIELASDGGTADLADATNAIEAICSATGLAMLNLPPMTGS